LGPLALEEPEQGLRLSAEPWPWPLMGGPTRTKEFNALD
jgi:hypothetical protein